MIVLIIIVLISFIDICSLIVASKCDDINEIISKNEKM